MFKIEDIKAAHSKVKSGADFPAYIKEIAALGVQSYQTFVSDGHVDYNGAGTFKIETPGKYDVQKVAPSADKDSFLRILKEHQQGKTDYPTFCSQCALYGIDSWVVDISCKTCTYYDSAGNKLLVESIPV